MKKLIKDMYGLIKAEDPEAQSQALMAKSAFFEMDADCDGKITTAEFIPACISQDKIGKMLALKVIDIFIDE
jgi:Ca2+-binding EF-hand superfamily protein